MEEIYKEPAEITIENLVSKIKHYYPNDADTILRAFKLAQDAHDGQFRASGRPYITHPCVVCDILIDLGLDVPTLCAALLHDTVEDTYVTDRQLRDEFGDEIANLVAGVTKLDKLQFASKEEEQAENIRKMFFAMAKDIRVIIIKLADRLHNMRSLQYLSRERQLAMAKETIDIFAPLAGRLGISQIKCELEDLCLKYLDPEAYEYLSEHIAMKQEERQSMVDSVIAELKKILKELGVDGEISGRTKHFYSIYKKMKNQGKSLDEIYDMTAVRVIVDTVKDCYNVLGAIHAVWKPIPGRIKDYIAVPKPNMYQSLHTTVITNLGAPFEIQIRTKEMHRVAEYGIAAHWKYKEGAFEKDISDKISWISDVISYDGEHKDSREFLDSIKKDVSISDEVFVFTPKGAVKNLQAGATALDFAYAVHSEVGNKCVGAKVNSKLVPLGHILENGDIARNFVKITGGLFLPYLYILVFMFLFTDSVTEYLWDVWYGISEIGLPRLAYSLPEIALAICTAFVLLHIFSTVFKNFIEHSDRMLLRISGAVLLFAFIVFILFSERELFEARLFFATAFSLMFSFHYKNIRRGSANAELVLLAILSLITAAGRFLI